MNNHKPTAQEIAAMASVAGVPVTDEVAARIANSIGPAFENFSSLPVTLPFDLEPATYAQVSSRCMSR
jgi:hypothetical protein